MVWNAFKAYVRGQYMCAIKLVKEECAVQASTLEQNDYEAVLAFATSPTGDNYSILAHAVENYLFILHPSHTLML